MTKRFLGSIKSATFVAASVAASFIAQGAFAQSWDGVYIGGHLGFGTGDAGWDFVSSVVGATDRGTLGQDINTDLNGFIAGMHVGRNWQSGRLVFGVEASLSGTGIDGSTASTFGVADDIYQTEIRSIAGIAGRLGFASGNRLFYIKGGYAGSRINTTILDTFPGNQQGNSSKWHNGYQIGAGAELASSNGLIWGLEYTYYDFASELHNVTFLPNGGNVTDNVSADLHSFSLRLSKKF